MPKQIDILIRSARICLWGDGAVKNDGTESVSNAVCIFGNGLGQLSAQSTSDCGSNGANDASGQFLGQILWHCWKQLSRAFTCRMGQIVKHLTTHRTHTKTRENIHKYCCKLGSLNLKLGIPTCCSSGRNSWPHRIVVFRKRGIWRIYSSCIQLHQEGETLWRPLAPNTLLQLFVLRHWCSSSRHRRKMLRTSI